jgi:uncharacterized Zn-finger protein
MTVPFEVIETDESIVACNGGGGPLGHPRVYLNLAPVGHHECPYCSRQFVNRALASASGIRSGAAMPSAHGPERPSESPAPRQPGSP